MENLCPREPTTHEKWVPEWSTLVRIATLGFFLNCKPSEAYLTPYLRDVKGFSELTLDASVWPYATYGQLAFLIPVGLAAECFGYRTTIFLTLLAREATRVLLVYGTTLSAMQVVEVAYSLGEAGLTIYYAYIYMVLDTRDFQLGTSLVYGGYYGGNLVGSLVAEVVQNYITKDLTVLFYISWCIVSFGFLIFFTLPSPRRNAPVSLAQMMIKDGFKATRKSVARMFIDTHVLFWSYWWILGYASLQVYVSYGATQVYDLDANVEYGFYEVGIYASFMLGALLPNIIKVNLLRDFTPLGIVILSSIEGICFFLSIECRSLVTLVTLHCIVVLVGTSLQVTATAVIALQIEEPRYAAITSLLTLGALIVNTVALEIASEKDWRTSDYFYFITVLQALLVVPFTMIIICQFITPFYHRRYRPYEKTLIADGCQSNLYNNSQTGTRGSWEVN